MKGQSSRRVTLEEKRRCGFALRELVAMVAIGAMVALLLPAWLNVLRQKRDGILCLTNGRQMMQAFALYAEDHSGLLPPNEDTTTGHTWCMGHASGLPVATNQAALGDPRINVMASYAADTGIWKCPADPATVVAGGKRVRTVRSVAMNSAVGTVCSLWPGSHAGAPVLATHGSWLDGVHGHTRGARFRTFGRAGEFVLPAETFVFIDEHPVSINDATFGHPGYSPENPTLSVVRWVDYPAVYHGQAAGITFADGHAEIHRWKGLTYPPTGLPGSSVTPAQRPDWEWLAIRATQPLR